MNNAKPSHIVGPALFGRYLLSPERKNDVSRAELSKNFPFTIELLEYADATSHSGETHNKVELQLSSAISGRDFVVLLALLHVKDNLSITCIEGGMSFLASDLKSILDLSNSGANTQTIELAIERLSNIEISFLISSNSGSHVVLEMGKIIESFNNGKIEINDGELSNLTCSRARIWYMRLGDGFKRTLENCETSKYKWDELLKHRKSSLTIAVQAHLQTIYGKKTFSKKVSTLFKNINSPLNASSWRECRHYRSRTSAQLKRLAKNIKSLVAPSTSRSLFLLPRLLVKL